MTHLPGGGVTHDDLNIVCAVVWDDPKSQPVMDIQAAWTAAPGTPPHVLQRGAWVLGNDPDTGRVARVFKATHESTHATADAAYAAIPPGEPVDRFDPAELLRSFGG